MKLAVFGGSGRTGRHIVQQALDRGHEVVALVRTPSKLGISNVGLTLIQGDACSATDVAKTVEGADAVISALALSSKADAGMMTTAARHIVAAMQQHGVTRLIAMSGAAIRDPNDTPPLFHRFMGRLVKLAGPALLADMEAAIGIFRSSGLDVTIVRGVVLTDAPRTGTYRVGYVSKDLGIRLSRADAADFILTELADGRWRGKMPAISG